ncbi:TIR and AAA domain-containing protein [Ktedonobacteria bacterium brp13]|nr:TIR and AAA domain-containing protein [Ktedonobacteria bacterium brp13]
MLESREPVQIFCAYALEDAAQFQPLKTSLLMLEKKKRIYVCYEHNIPAGAHREQTLTAAIEHAAIILLIITTNFFNSDEQHEKMIEHILQREAANDVHVIPILLRSVNWQYTPFAHLQPLPADGRSIKSRNNVDEAFTEVFDRIYPIIDQLAGQAGPEQQGPNRKRTFLQALRIDHSGFRQGRASSFVGRAAELTDIQQHITELQASGGYLTITGQAGQGKSSIIASFIELHDPGSIQHFIPFNPGPDHQVTLLRDLMAQLILKYDLDDIYVASDHRPALRDFFPKVLQEVERKGGRELIFIDGLDQIKEDMDGIRDLSFLPLAPPAGIVFVLGTRPNDTLQPLELLKPHYMYQLPNLSRPDFDLLLQQRHIQISPEMAARFYEAMEENALYLNLVAKELAQTEAFTPEEIIQRVATNPNNIFTLSIDRLRRNRDFWDRVIEPLLGVLLVTREPLTLRMLKDILALKDAEIREGLQKLGGLVMQDGQEQYSLFHLKLQDYLKQDKESVRKDYIFSLEEVEAWQAKFAQWCAGQDGVNIWQDARKGSVEQERRGYARQHYVTHLYEGGVDMWPRLFQVLDEGSYGHGKLQDDPSTRLYAQDLDLGRKAAAWSEWGLQDGVQRLPILWRYTLLRCSLTSRVDNYPDAAFRLLWLLGREQEALNLIELLSNPSRKVAILLMFATLLDKQLTRESEQWQLLLRAREVIKSIESSNERAEALSKLGKALSKAGKWEEAEETWEEAREVIKSIESSNERAWALSKLGGALSEAGKWEEAREVIKSIESSNERARALSELGGALSEAGKWEEAREVIKSIEQSDERAEALSKLGGALSEAGKWEEAEETWEEAEETWEEAREVIKSIESSDERVEALSELGGALSEAGKWEEAEEKWEEAREVIKSMVESEERARVLSELGGALSEAGKWEEAREVIKSIEESYIRVEALSGLGGALSAAGKWEEAQEVVKSIAGSKERARALVELTNALNVAGKHDDALSLIQSSWVEAKTRKDALALFPMALGLIPAYPQLGMELFKGFAWVDSFLLTF